MFSRTTFYLRHEVQFVRFFDGRDHPRLFPNSRKSIQNLELDLGKNVLFRLFSVPTTTSAVGYLDLSKESLGNLFENWVMELSLRRVRINFPPISARGYSEYNNCQKTLCLCVWASARVLFRDVPFIELDGSIDQKQKQEWLQELALERKGVVPDLSEVKVWQEQIRDQWYSTSQVSRCHPC